MRVQGDRLVDASGSPLRLLGVDRSGSEYACVQGWGIFDGPTDASAIASMASWHINAVRVPLNEDCWLGINGVDPAYSGQNYQSAIGQFVTDLHQAGFVVILDLHYNAPGSTKATDVQVMADADHSPAFWSSVASFFRVDPGLIFDLYNEPHDISWGCWRDGCTTSSSWRTAGMQSLVDAVRSTGATQPIMLGGPDWASDLSQWQAFRPTDVANQLVASFHVYNFSGCSTRSCWDSTVAPLATSVPVVTGELGEDDCASGFIGPYMAWADAHAISYLGWAWDAWDCRTGPALITGYDGTPTGFGAGLKAHLAALAANATSTTTTSPAPEPQAHKVAAWLPYWDQDRALASFVQHASLYSEASPYWYDMVSAGTVNAFPRADDPNLLSAVRSRGVRLVPTITNDADPTRVHRMLSSDARVARQVALLTNLVTSHGYDGIDVDYENLRADDRSAFSNFLFRLASSLHKAGRWLTVDVHAKTSEPGDWNGAQAQDWAAIGSVVDRLRVMAYDFHWDTSPPGPIAPLWWVDRVAALAASEVTPARVELGMPLYGYDWVGNQAQDHTFDEIVAEMRSSGADRKWSSADAEPWFQYADSAGGQHTAWYDDHDAIAAKLPLIAKYGFAGPVFWRLGGEDPNVWGLLG